jgi:hypothetical protein
VILRLRAVAESPRNAAARVRALELLGRHLGMFAGRWEHRHGGTRRFRLHLVRCGD